MDPDMKRVIATFFLVLVFMLFFGGMVEASTINQPPVQPIAFENVSIIVECRTANISVTCTITSEDPNLIHFPYGIDMYAEGWINVTSVNVGFSRGFCFLIFDFENVDNTTARRIADDLKDDFEKVFRITYVYESTEVNDYVKINYVGQGVANLPQYTQELMEDCLAQGFGGFSTTFVPMTEELTAMTILSATKSSGDIHWEYGMTVIYSKSMTPGTGIHTIDVLELLHVEQLEPSPYSDLSVAGGSVQIYGVATFVACEPAQAQEPGERGWYILPLPGGILLATFSFGGNSTPFTDLWLKFSGTVIPEFTIPTWTTTLIIALIVITTLKKQLKCKTPPQHINFMLKPQNDRKRSSD